MKNLVFLLCAFALCACERPTLYEYQAVPQEGWLCTDTLRFELDEIPHDGWYALTLGVRYTNTLPYDDLWLVMERRQGEHYRHRDTLHITALQNDSVNWQSQGIVLHEREELVTATRFTTQQMPIELLVYHIMRSQSLTGISDIGVKVQ